MGTERTQSMTQPYLIPFPRSLSMQPQFYQSRKGTRDTKGGEGDNRGTKSGCISAAMIREREELSTAKVYSAMQWA